jgi:hypothetical protein
LIPLRFSKLVRFHKMALEMAFGAIIVPAAFDLSSIRPKKGLL